VCSSDLHFCHQGWNPDKFAQNAVKKSWAGWALCKMTKFCAGHAFEDRIFKTYNSSFSKKEFFYLKISVDSKTSFVKKRQTKLLQLWPLSIHECFDDFSNYC
jgi:hypothetical protein